MKPMRPPPNTTFLCFILKNFSQTFFALFRVISPLFTNRISVKNTSKLCIWKAFENIHLWPLACSWTKSLWRVRRSCWARWAHWSAVSRLFLCWVRCRCRAWRRRLAWTRARRARRGRRGCWGWGRRGRRGSRCSAGWFWRWTGSGRSWSSAGICRARRRRWRRAMWLTQCPRWIANVGIKLQGLQRFRLMGDVLKVSSVGFWNTVSSP